jgi:chromosome segregation ATPase
MKSAGALETQQWVEEKKALEEKLQQAAEYIQYQDEQLAAKDEELVVKSKEVELRDQELLILNTQQLSLEEKVKQAAEFIQYQEELIAEHTVEVEGLKACFEETKSNLESDKALLSRELESMTLNLNLSQELRKSLAERDLVIVQLQEKLTLKDDELQSLNGDFIEIQKMTKHLQIQLVDCESKLREEHKNWSEAKALFEMKIQQAAEFIQYQDDQLAERQEEFKKLQQDKQIDNESSAAATIELRVENSKLREKLYSVESELASKVSDFEQQCTDFKFRIEELSADLKSTRQEISENQLKMLEQNKELMILRSSSVSRSNDDHHILEELTEAKAKLQQAADFIAYQDERIAILETTNGDIASQDSNDTAALINLQSELQFYQQFLISLLKKLIQILPDSRNKSMAASLLENERNLRSNYDNIQATITNLCEYCHSLSATPKTDPNKVDRSELDIAITKLKEVEKKLKEKEDDFEKLVHDLIDAKMQVANAMNDVDNERKKANDLRRQLRSLS